MSGSPKYTRAQLREIEERRLREERARRAEEEAARRAKEEARRRRERLANAKAEVRKFATDLGARIDRFDATEASRFVGGELQELRSDLRRAAEAAQKASDEAEVQKLGGALGRVGERLAQVSARGEAALFAAHLAKEEAVVDGLERRVAALDQERSRKFDGTGLDGVLALVAEAREALTRQDPAKAAKTAGAATARLEQHVSVVERRHTAWQQERHDALAAIAEAEDRVAGLEADEIVMRWCAAEVLALRGQIATAGDQVAAERFIPAREAAASIAQGVESCIARAQETQLKEERRQYVAAGIVQVMQRMGFVVQAGCPSLHDPSVPASDMIIQAQRLGGGAVAVSVPQEGEVWYDVDGFPMRVETGSDGQQVKSCDEAEQAITAMHQALEDAFGIQMSELMWEGKDPGRRARQADALPGSRDAAQRSGRRQ